MSKAKLLNWTMQAVAVAAIAGAVLSYGKVTWDTTKILMGTSLVFAFSAFFHALVHYIAESR